eukprot:m51a1_g11769 putative gnat family acetyltransferase (137) ;mRNA; f:239918-240462
MSFVVRQASQSDAALLAHAATLGPLDERTVFAALSSPLTSVHVATDERGEVVGTAAVAIEVVVGGRKAVVGELLVAPQWRGRGVDVALLDACCASARADGARYCDFEAEPTPESAELCQKAGFERRGTNVYCRPLN